MIDIVRVLVTGAAGNVGSAIARLASEQGYEVLRVWHNTRPSPLIGAHDLRCDLADPDDIASLPIDVGAVIHAAARIPTSEWSDLSAASANRNTNRVLLDHFAETRFSGSWVHLSSVSLEHDVLRAVSPYAIEKAETEEQISRAFPGRARSLRISSPYGPNMRHMNVLRRFAEAARSGQQITLLGTGERTQDFVHADDVAAAALAAIRVPGGAPVVVASGAPISMSALAQLLVGIIKSDSRIEHSGKPDPQERFRANYDIRPALDSLGWAPAIRLEVGLRAMLESM